MHGLDPLVRYRSIWAHRISWPDPAHSQSHTQNSQNHPHSGDSAASQTGSSIDTDASPADISHTDARETLYSSGRVMLVGLWFRSGIEIELMLSLAHIIKIK